MNELIFVGMDIAEEVKFVSSDLFNRITDGMTDGERRAYKLGITNTISVLRGLLNCGDGVVVNVPELEEAMEFTYDDLERYLLDDCY